MKIHQTLLGNRYGKLVVEQQLPSDKNGQRRWLCRCDCGNTHIATTGNLNSGHTTNCGCKKSPDLTGKVFGKLTVLGRSDKRAPRGQRSVPMWECKCECGNITYKATDTLNNPQKSMCQECHGKYASEKARKHAGFVCGTQLSKIIDMTPASNNTTGVRGVSYDKNTNKYRTRLKFKGKSLSFGYYTTMEEAVAARRKAELQYFGAFLNDLASGK